jgi:acyl-CoA synthetase (AMP-forming)/AMP-acid ligase II
VNVNALERLRLVVDRDLTLGTTMERLARAHGTRRLVEEHGDGLRLTYVQAAKRVARWAGGVARKAEPGDRVVLCTPNGYELLLLALATSRAGAIPVPLSAGLPPDELTHVTRDCGAVAVLRSAAEIDGAEPLLRPQPQSADEVAALLYTSGTTGRPKGVELTHRALIGQFGAAALWPAGLRRDEAVVALPIAHVMGFATLLGLASAGIPVYFLPRFRPDDVLDAIERRRATVFVGVPAMYRMLLEAGAESRDLRSVRLWMSGADSMPADLAERFKRFGATASLPFVGPVGEAAFAEGYGMVELGGGAAAKLSPPGLGFGLGPSVGVRLPGYRFRVVDDDGHDVRGGEAGELWIKGPGVTKGYWGDAAATASAVTADGWLRTGDLARRGALGSVLFAGRKKDVIKHGGFSVYALEVERTLETHPDVVEAAVVGLPDVTKGEVPAAVVRMRPGATLDEDGLRGWVATYLAEYKVPVRVIAVDDLPRTGTRKVQKAPLVDLFDPTATQ